jgi:Acyltransferase family
MLQAACANMLLLPAPVLLARSPFAFPVDIPLWSLAFEIWINLLYALFFKLLTRFTLGLVLAVGAVLVLTVSLGYRGVNVGFQWHGFYLGGAGECIRQPCWQGAGGTQQVLTPSGFFLVT